MCVYAFFSCIFELFAVSIYDWKGYFKQVAKTATLHVPGVVFSWQVFFGDPLLWQ